MLRCAGRRIGGRIDRGPFRPRGLVFSRQLGDGPRHARIQKLIDSNTNKDKFGTPFIVRSANILPLRIVEHPNVKRAIPLLGNGAYLALASGFIMTDVFFLRVMLVAGYSGLAGFHLLHTRPLRIPLIWSCLFVAVNAAMAAQLASERFVGLSEEDEIVRVHFFSRLTRGQFKQILELGERVVLPDGSALTTQRRESEHLFFIERGVVRLEVDGERMATIGRGGFVNDVAFQQGPGATACASPPLQAPCAHLPRLPRRSTDRACGRACAKPDAMLRDSESAAAAALPSSRRWDDLGRRASHGDPMEEGGLAQGGGARPALDGELGPDAGGVARGPAAHTVQG